MSRVCELTGKRLCTAIMLVMQKIELGEGFYLIYKIFLYLVKY